MSNRSGPTLAAVVSVTSCGPCLVDLVDHDLLVSPPLLSPISLSPELPCCLLRSKGSNQRETSNIDYIFA